MTSLIISAAIGLSAPALQHTTPVIPIESINQVNVAYPKNTIFLFDLDDMIMEHQGMLGSKKWREYIKENTKGDSSANWHDLLSLFVARHYPTCLIEEETKTFIERLQQEGYPTFGFTARERNIWYATPCKEVDLLTLQQLSSTGVDFTHMRLQECYRFLTQDAACVANIFFADTDTKGAYVDKIFTGAETVPEMVIFFDDKRANCDTVKEALDRLGIANVCYLYTKTALKAFDPLIANIELYYLVKDKKILTDDEAQVIAERNPEQDASYYLDLVLELSR